MLSYKRLVRKVRSKTARHRFKHALCQCSMITGLILGFVIVMAVLFYWAEYQTTGPADTSQPTAPFDGQDSGIGTTGDAASGAQSTALSETLTDSDDAISETIWKIAVYFFTGFADYEPRTTSGKIISVIVFLFGIGLVATMTGRIASIFVARELEKKMPNTMHDHIVICNWNKRGDRIVSELHSDQGAPDTEIVVIADQEINKAEYRARPEYEGVTFIHSDPSIHDVLRICHAHRARAVIILADETGHIQDPDSDSALIALAIKRLAKDDGIHPPHIAAEVLNHRRIQHLRDAGVDEVVCGQDVGLGILAQSAIHPGLTEVFNRLLTYTSDSNEIYIVDRVPRMFHGLNFAQISEILARNRDAKNPAILIGIKRGENIILNVRNDDRGNALGPLRAGDQLICIAYEKPDLSTFETMTSGDTAQPKGRRP